MRFLKTIRTAFLLLFLGISASGRLHAQQTGNQDPPPSGAAADSTGPKVGHGSKGFFIQTADEAWLVQLQFRLQFRMSTPYNSDPVTFDDYRGDPKTSLAVNRARLKVGGHGFQPWLKYYFEYELAASNLLNFEVMVERYPQASVRVGQWKAQYSRERAISSGRQQLMDRSLINRYFTLDRQQGISLFGRLGAGTTADVSYWLSAFTGMGRGGGANDDQHLMYMGRVQWNPLGRPVPFVGSDLNASAPALSVALGGATNRSSCTRFSQDGCGSLDGFEDAAPGQYRVNQAIFETAFLWRGFSWAQELHWKQIDDTVEGATTTLSGHYAQIGYFPGQALDWVPPQLEVTFRHAMYRPDVDLEDNRKEEFTTAVNWFFSGHDNKLTAEFSWLTLQSDATGLEEGGRFRLQWDVQF